MTAQRAIRPLALTGAALLFASLVALTPMRLTVPSLPEIQVSAIDLTAADVPDVPTFDYILNDEIPHFIQTINDTYQQQFADLSDIWSSGLSNLSWTDGGASIEALNQEVLDWINHVNLVGLNFVEDMDVVTGPDGLPIYDPSLCNIVFNIAAAGNAWLAELNTGAMAGMEGLNQGLADYFDGLTTWGNELASWATELAASLG